MNIRTLNKKLKSLNRDTDTEVTRFKGEIYLLHICKNGVPVPLIYSKDISEINNYIDAHIEVKNETANS